jgi:pyridoxamine 5'-phosphate oxidase
MSPRRPDNPPLSRSELAGDPFEQFAAWFGRAREEAPLAEAITLATVDQEGAPDARMVLLKGFGADGFRFFTNYESDKAGQLESAGRAAIVAYWRELDRQVRARGTVRRLPDEFSDAYFATRSRGAQLGAWASPQSSRISDRDELERRLAEAQERFAGADVPRPPQWGGYLLEPERIEFWQGQLERLHDRFLYSREPDGSWSLERLAP